MEQGALFMEQEQLRTAVGGARQCAHAIACRTIFGEPHKSYGDVHARLECLLRHYPRIDGLVARSGLEDDRPPKAIEEPVHVVCLMQRKESLAERDPGHLEGTAILGRQLLTHVVKRLRDQLLGLCVEHTAADGGDGTSRFGLAAPLQGRRTGALDEVGARRHVDSAAESSTRYLHVDSALGAIREQLDFHLELAPYRPDSNFDDRLQMRGILNGDVDDIGERVADFLWGGNERPDSVEADRDLLLAAVLQVHTTPSWLPRRESRATLCRG